MEVADGCGCGEGGVYPRFMENRLETGRGCRELATWVSQSHLPAGSQPRVALVLPQWEESHTASCPRHAACVRAATLAMDHACQFLCLPHPFKFSKPRRPTPSNVFFKGNSFLKNFSSETFFPVVLHECTSKCLISGRDKAIRSQAPIQAMGHSCTPCISASYR